MQSLDQYHPVRTDQPVGFWRDGMSKRTFPCCSDCRHRDIHWTGVALCALKRELEWDCVGIHTAADGTAIGCPLKTPYKTPSRRQ